MTEHITRAKSWLAISTAPNKYKFWFEMNRKLECCYIALTDVSSDSSGVRAADCRSAGPPFKSGSELAFCFGEGGPRRREQEAIYSVFGANRGSVDGPPSTDGGPAHATLPTCIKATP